MNNSLRPILEASSAKNKEAKKMLEKENYKLDKGLSTKEAKVFIDKNGNPNIAVRGSKSAKDFLVSDPLLALGLGNLDPRQKATDKQAGPSQVEAFENEKGRMHSLRLFCSFSIFLMNSVMVVVHQNGASK